MLKKSKFNQKGFTIIEVALVLAIAALIFLVVFLAVPALQRNQRDDARKRDVSNVVAAVTTLQANTGKQPTVDNGSNYVYNKGSKGTNELAQYIDKMSNNVDVIRVQAGSTMNFGTGQGYETSKVGNTSERVPRVNTIIVYTGAKCDGNTKMQAASWRSNAVVVQIENGGDGKYYCQDAS